MWKWSIIWYERVAGVVGIGLCDNWEVEWGRMVFDLWNLGIVFGVNDWSFVGFNDWEFFLVGE